MNEVSAFQGNKLIFELPKALGKNYCLKTIRDGMLKIDNHGHGDNGHGIVCKDYRANKDFFSSSLSSILTNAVKPLKLKGFDHVDPMMKIYELKSPKGSVPPHFDEDFRVNGLHAIYSIIVYLNDGYKGGHTIFEGSKSVSPTNVGDALIFHHRLMHEGLPVTRGTKYVLKSDLLFKAPA